MIKNKTTEELVVLVSEFFKDRVINNKGQLTEIHSDRFIIPEEYRDYELKTYQDDKFKTGLLISKDMDVVLAPAEYGYNTNFLKDMYEMYINHDGNIEQMKLIF